MKNNLLLALALLWAISFSSCMKDDCVETHQYKVYHPVYLSYEELRSSVASLDPQTLKNTGKIYLYNHWLFVNDPGKGVHVIDNSQPENPQKKSFINIPGNVDISIKNNFLYADSYIDLVVIDVSNPLAVNEVMRLENIFPASNWNTGFYTDPEKGFLIDYIATDTLIKMDCNLYNNVNYYMEGDLAFSDSQGGVVPTANSSGNSNSPGTVGIAGSMARFAINDNHLYAINNGALQNIDISNPAQPVMGSTMQVGWNIETLFPFQHYLFIGSQSGMYIYDINGNDPLYVSQLAHVNSCDPVVVSGDYAYVTLRNGTTCGGFTNQLDIVNISNILAPYLEYSYPMHNPYGLGIDGETLFLCDGTAGLKVFDVTDKAAISDHLLYNYPNVNAFDVIPHNQILIMVAEEGIFQYNFSDLSNIIKISSIFEGQ